MKSRPRIRRRIRRLAEIRNRFEPTAAREKLQLLQLIADGDVRSSTDLKRHHDTLCFVTAYPDTLAHYRLARAQLDSFEELVKRVPAASRGQFADTGIIGTEIYYRFSYEVATWLAIHAPGLVSIDWDEIDDTTTLDGLLERMLRPAEADFFDSGQIECRAWIELSTSATDSTDFDWLAAQLRDSELHNSWPTLYNTADLPLIWKLSDAGLSKSRNAFPIRKVETRENGLRKRPPAAKKEIVRPLASISRLSSRAGSRMIDVAMGSLAVRHRETYHFNHANPKEVYLADVGEGVAIAVFGLAPDYRYPLECTMGFLILANGMPIGYGGASIVFSQVNTGINIFDEYRGGEAYFLWIQVMRVYHHLTGCTRFIADAYQFGNDNEEALQSGAFWFYYRLGYRPILSRVRKLALQESSRIRRNKSYRSDLSTLRRLASCDMHLTLPGALANELFDEQRIELSSLLATRELAAIGESTRAASANRVAAKVACDLGIRDLHRWSRARRVGFRILAPIVLATDPAAWPTIQKGSMKQLMYAKGGPSEADFARQLSRHTWFLSALRERCRIAMKTQEF